MKNRRSDNPLLHTSVCLSVRQAVRLNVEDLRRSCLRRAVLPWCLEIAFGDHFKIFSVAVISFVRGFRH